MDIKEILNYDNLRKMFNERFKCKENDYFLIYEDEDLCIDEYLLLKKINKKEDLKKIKNILKDSMCVVEGDRVDYAIVFDLNKNEVIFLYNDMEGLNYKLRKIKLNIDKLDRLRDDIKHELINLINNISDFRAWVKFYDVATSKPSMS